MPEVTRELTDAVLEVIREQMDLEGWSGKRMAAATGISQPTLAGHLRGEGCLTLDKIDAIGRALGEDLEQLLARARLRL